MKLLFIDNFDSFTYNIVQAFQQLGCEVHVVRNNAFTVAECADFGADGIILGPGPGAPAAAGITIPLIHALHSSVPLFGICLGMQAIGAAFGGVVIRAQQPIHGKTSPIFHENKGVFHGLPSPFLATRYHSLVIEKATLPRCLEITAETKEGEIMGVRHRTFFVEGVQFHPESIASTHGLALFKNFLYSIETFKKESVKC